MANDQTESSKQGKKRSKRLKLAAISISQQQGNEGIRISERGSNPSPDQNSIAQRMPSPRPSTSNEVPNQPIEEEERPRKSKRGRTKMRTLSLTPNDRVKVEFNERGQPIGLHSKWLSSYLGALARDMVPVTAHDWRKVTQTVKDDLWKCVLARFMIDDLYKKLFVQVMGTRWREFKSRLITSLREASKLPDKESRYAILKPDNIKSPQEWNDFVAQKLSDEFEVKSEKFKEIRAKNQTPHTMSRKGYARLEDDMRKESPNTAIRRVDVWCKAHTKKNGEVPTAFIADCVSKIQEFNSSQTSPSTSLHINEDALSHTLGPERNGRVRGMGFGITPSLLGVHTKGSKNVEALRNQVSNLTNQVEFLKNLVMKSMASKNNEDANTPSPGSHSIASRVNVIDKTPSHPSNNGSSNLRDCTNLNAIDVPKNGDVGTKCKLLNWQKTVVAEGKIASTDPNALVHHVPLGKDVWKVWVVVPIVPKDPLWRPNSNMSLIEDAVGSTVAWLKDFISFD